MVWPSPLTIVKTSLMRHNYIYAVVLRSAVTKYRRFILGDLLFKCCRCLKVKESQTSHRTDNKYEYNTLKIWPKYLCRNEMPRLMLGKLINGAALC